MSVFKLFGKIITSPFVALWRAFDTRDVFLLGGLAMLGRGLYLRWGEWVALIICGVLLIFIALFYGVNRKKADA